MNKIDLIIDALESAHHTNDTGVMGLTKSRHDVALAAAQELKALKPVAIRNPTNGMIEVQWGASVPLGRKLYALDEVTK
jgi:hypothetical protein